MRLYGSQELLISGQPVLFMDLKGLAQCAAAAWTVLVMIVSDLKPHLGAPEDTCLPDQSKALRRGHRNDVVVCV